MEENLVVQNRVQVLSPMGTIFVDEQKQKYVFVVLFYFSLWSARKITCIRFQRMVFRTVYLRFPARCGRAPCCSSLRPTYSSHEMRMVFNYIVNAYFHSTFTLQVAGCDFPYGSNIGVPSNPNLLVQINFRLLAKCAHDKQLNLWIVRITQCLSLWSAVRLQLWSGILQQYKFCSICLVVTFQFVPDRSKVCVSSSHLARIMG